MTQTSPFIPKFKPGTFPWPNGKRVAVSLSFDDARASQVDVGQAVLDKHGVKATFYVMPLAVEKKLEGWKRLRDAGHEIGNHSMTHPCSGNFLWARPRALEELTLEKMKADIAQADEALARLLGVRAETFAYPCGQTFVGRGEATRSYVPLIAERFVAGRGFRQEAHNDPAYCDAAHVGAFDFDCATADEVIARIRAAETDRAWLVLAGHEIGGDGRQIVNASVLDTVCKYCADPANGVWIDTVAAVAKHVVKTRQ